MKSFFAGLIITTVLFAASIFALDSIAISVIQYASQSGVRVSDQIETE